MERDSLQASNRPGSAQDVIALRARHGWTQAQLAERLGVSTRTVVNWEKNGVPNGKALISLGLVEAEVTLGSEQSRPMQLPSDYDRGDARDHRLSDLEARVDYLERMVLKMRADNLGEPKPPTADDFGLAAHRPKIAHESMEDDGDHAE